MLHDERCGHGKWQGNPIVRVDRSVRNRVGGMRLQQQRGCPDWYRSNNSGGDQMGALYRRTGNEMESGRAHYDARNELRYSDPQGKSGSRRSARSSMAHPFHSLFGPSWAGHSRENIGMLPFFTMSPMTSTTGRGRIATGCFTTRCVAVGLAEPKPKPCIIALQIRESLEVSDSTRKTGEVQRRAGGERRRNSPRDSSESGGDQSARGLDSATLTPISNRSNNARNRSVVMLRAVSDRQPVVRQDLRCRFQWAIFRSNLQANRPV